MSEKEKKGSWNEAQASSPHLMQHQIHPLMKENLRQFNKGSLQGEGSCTRAK